MFRICDQGKPFQRILKDLCAKGLPFHPVDSNSAVNSHMGTAATQQILRQSHPVRAQAFHFPHGGLTGEQE
jgi:hypothetical protein